MDSQNEAAQLQECVKAFDAGKDLEVVELATPLSQSRKEETRRAASEMLGTSLFCLKRYSDAGTVWLSLANDTQVADHWLSAVTSTTMARDFEAAERAFTTAIAKFNERALRQTEEGITPVPGTNTGPRLMLYYAHALCDAEAPERAISLVDEFAAMFCELSITDDHFMLTRGMITLDEYLTLLRKVVSTTFTHRNSDEWSAFLAKLRAGVDEDGKLKIDAVRWF